MKIKLEGTPTKTAGEALSIHGAGLYATLGRRLIGIVELEAVERNEVADDDDKETWVKVRVSQLEIANSDQEEAIRDAMHALNVHRTAYGTLTEDQEIELTKGTIERCAGNVTLAEAARLHAAIDRFGDKILASARDNKLNTADLRRTVTETARALLGTIYPNMLPVDPD